MNRNQIKVCAASALLMVAVSFGCKSPVKESAAKGAPFSGVQSTNKLEEIGAIAEIWELQNVNGRRLGVIVRREIPDDKALGTKIAPINVVDGYGMAVIGIQWPDGRRVRWGDEAEEPVSFWKDVDGKMYDLFAQVEQHAQRPQPKIPKDVKVGHPAPLITTVDLSSDAVRKAQGVSCIIYKVFPNKVTAVACIGSTGLVVLDELGGNEGVRYVGTGLFGTGPGIVVPKNPKKFGANYVKTTINPFKQAQLYAKVAQPIVRLIPGGKETVHFGKKALEVPADWRILGTTPSHAIASWQKDPLAAAKQTGESVAKARILGTSMEQTAKKYKEDPVGAAGHAIETSIINPIKSLFK